MFREEGGRFVVFLKEAYDGTNLVHKNEGILLKEEYAGLMDGKKPPKSGENRFIERRTCLHENNSNATKPQECCQLRMKMLNFMPWWASLRISRKKM